MAAAAILHFRKSGILGYSNLDMANVYQRTKFEANICIVSVSFGANDTRMANVDLHTNFGEIGAEMAEVQLFTYFQHGVGHLGFMLTSGVMIRSDLAKMLRFQEFADVAGKCLFTPPPVGGLRALTPKVVRYR